MKHTPSIRVPTTTNNNEKSPLSVSSGSGKRAHTLPLHRRFGGRWGVGSGAPEPPKLLPVPIQKPSERPPSPPGLPRPPPQRPPRRPKRPQDAPKTPPGRPQEAPGRPQDAPGTSNINDFLKVFADVCTFPGIPPKMPKDPMGLPQDPAGPP